MMQHIMTNPQLIFPLYLFYGMAFLAIGVSITSRDMSVSNLKIARPLRFFALFAYSHALLEWFTLHQLFYSVISMNELLPWVNGVHIALLSGSFGMLLMFGVSLLRVAHPAWRNWILLIPLLLFTTFLVSLSLHEWSHIHFPFMMTDIHIRNLIGFPSALIASLGFVFYSRTVRAMSSKGAKNFAGAGYSLAVYGVLTGLVPSGTLLPLVDVPVELVRGLSAFVILHFIMNALHTFDVERKLVIEERLQRFAKAEKLNSLGKLAFGIAHEVNNPLTNVSLTMELLRDELRAAGDLTESRAKRFVNLERNLGRASKIAQELLFFSTDKGDAYQLTDMNELLQGTLELLGAKRKDFRLRLELQSPTPILVIPWKVEEVFLNLLSNAIEALGDGGEIRILSCSDEDHLQIKIIDNGPGIAKEDLPFVLDPFFTTKDVGQGTGLGLSICFGIMEMHGGSIEVTSEPGLGTEVTLLFPVGDRKHVANSDR